jgi:hypothetical protein
MVYHIYINVLPLCTYSPYIMNHLVSIARDGFAWQTTTYSIAAALASASLKRIKHPSK